MLVSLGLVSESTRLLWSQFFLKFKEPIVNLSEKLLVVNFEEVFDRFLAVSPWFNAFDLFDLGPLLASPCVLDALVSHEKPSLTSVDSLSLLAIVLRSLSCC